MEPRQEGFNVQLGKLGEAINFIALLLKERKKKKKIQTDSAKKKR